VPVARPDAAGRDSTAGPRRRRRAGGTAARLPGTFAAAGAAFDENDVLHGAAFLWMRAGNEPRLERVDWTLDSRDNFAEIGRQRVAWDFERSMDDARVRFNLEGTPAALFHENVGRWVVCMPDGDLKPVPAPYTETRHPIDLGFYGATDPPVLIVGRPLMGFDIRMLDGSPLPRRGG